MARGPMPPRMEEMGRGGKKMKRGSLGSGAGVSKAKGTSGEGRPGRVKLGGGTVGVKHTHFNRERARHTK
jgi:hypothetical protein